MNEPKKASDTLKRARDLLITRGWTIGDLARDSEGRGIETDGDGGYGCSLSRADRTNLRNNGAEFCSLGAIRTANGPGEAAAVELLAQVAVQIILAGGGTVISELDYALVYRFNDSFAGTAAEVIAAFDAAYVLALQEEGLEPEDVLG